MTPPVDDKRLSVDRETGPERAHTARTHHKDSAHRAAPRWCKLTVELYDDQSHATLLAIDADSDRAAGYGSGGMYKVDQNEVVGILRKVTP